MGTGEGAALRFEDAQRHEDEIVELLTRKLPPGAELPEG